MSRRQLLTAQLLGSRLCIDPYLLSVALSLDPELSTTATTPDDLISFPIQASPNRIIAVALPGAANRKTIIRTCRASRLHLTWIVVDFKFCHPCHARIEGKEGVSCATIMSALRFVCMIVRLEGLDCCGVALKKQDWSGGAMERARACRSFLVVCC